MHFRESLYLPAQDDTRRISGGDTAEYATTIGTHYTEEAEKATRKTTLQRIVPQDVVANTLQ